MTEPEFYRWVVWAIFGSSVVSFLYLLRGPAPYGRHHEGAGWGPSLPSKVGWIVMEWPAVFLFLIIYFRGEYAWGVVPLVFLAMWQSHYLNRSLIYPLRTRTKGRMPVLVVLSGYVFNCSERSTSMRGSLRTSATTESPGWLIPDSSLEWHFSSVRMSLNMHADNVLLGLRKQGRTGYVVPQGGAYRTISCPNYLGEILEWTGWAVATWSLGGLAFAVFTAANLIPRARSNHRWYRENFPDYPANRRALIPGVF